MRIDRTIVVAMFLASGLSACAAKGPAAFTDADGTAIRATVDSFTNAVKNNDFAGAASYYAEDGVIMPPNTPAVTGRAGIQKGFEGFGHIDAFSQAVLEVDGVGDLAFARATYDVTFTPAGAKAPINDKGKVLIVMRKQADGKWRTIRGMHSSDLPSSGPMPKA